MDGKKFGHALRLLFSLTTLHPLTHISKSVAYHSIISVDYRPGHLNEIKQGIESSLY